MLEEARNKVESYIYKIKNKLEDNEETISKVTTDKQREEVRKLAVDAEEWLYDEGYSADLATMEDKYAELSVPFEKIMLRVSETTDRPEAVLLLTMKLTEIEQLMVKWATDRPQVTEEERASVLSKVEEARKWLADQEKAQSKKKSHEEPAFLSTDVPKQLLPIETIILRLSKKPKPKPPKKNATTTDENATAADNETASDAANATEAGDTASEETPADAETEAAGESAEQTEGEAAEEEL